MKFTLCLSCLFLAVLIYYGDAKKSKCSSSQTPTSTQCPSQTPRPGQCPTIGPSDVGICIIECSNDYECTANPSQKCCRNACGGSECVDPVTSTCQSTKPGQCPSINPTATGSVGICANECTGDYDCKKASKCCPNECGGSVCQDPVTSTVCPSTTRTPKPGQCPPVGSTDVGICIYGQCTDDYDCTTDPAQKCCINGCGASVCQDPVTSTCKSP